MSDLIRRVDAIRVISGLSSGFVKYIEELPSAQPERKTGHWIKTGHVDHTWLVSSCSVCGRQTIDAGNYCPNCGAHMKGEPK